MSDKSQGYGRKAPRRKRAITGTLRASSSGRALRSEFPAHRLRTSGNRDVEACNCRVVSDVERLTNINLPVEHRLDESNITAADAPTDVQREKVFFLRRGRPPNSTLFPYTTLFR